MCLAPPAEPGALREAYRHLTELMKAAHLSFITLSKPELRGAYQIESDCAAQGHILLCMEQHSPTAPSHHGKKSSHVSYFTGLRKRILPKPPSPQAFL